MKRLEHHSNDMCSKVVVMVMMVMMVEVKMMAWRLQCVQLTLTVDFPVTVHLTLLQPVHVDASDACLRMHVEEPYHFAEPLLHRGIVADTPSAKKRDKFNPDWWQASLRVSFRQTLLQANDPSRDSLQ